MPRNRVIYQSEGLYASKEANSTGSGDHSQLKRVQSANYSFNIARQDVNQYGELARIDSIVLESPTVSLDFSYYLTDGENEKALGFYVSSPTGTGVAGVTAFNSLSQFPSGQLRDGSGQNFYILTTDEGDDLNSEATITSMTGKSAIGIGNAYLTDYSVELAVGSIPTVSVSFEGSNMNAFNILSLTGAGFTGIGGANVGIVQESGTTLGNNVFFKLPQSKKTGSAPNTDFISALRPGDVTISFGNFTGSGLISNLNDLHVQSASMSLPLGRTPIERLNSKFAFVRAVDFPVVSTLTVNGVQSDAGPSGSLLQYVDSNPKQDITITIKKPGATTTGASDIAVQYFFKQAQLDSASVSSSIGSNKTVDFTFTTQIGGVNDTTNGIQMRGVHSGSVFS